MAEANSKGKVSGKPTGKAVGVKHLVSILVSSVKLLVVLSLIGGGYFIWQQQKIISTLQITQAQIAIDNDNLLNQLNAAQENVENITNTEASSELLFNQQNVRLDNLNEELVSLRLGMNANQSGVWQIAEAASSLRLAQQYLNLMQDISIALSLYQNSDAILSQIDDAALDRIKSLLASDIQTLRNSRGVDTEAFFMRLSDLSQQIENVSMGSKIEPSTAFQNASVSGGDEGYFFNFNAFLSRYFTVRRLDSPIVVPLNNQQVSFLRQNMQLQIEQAKLALLQRRQAIYQDSISNVIMLVQQNVSEEDQQKSYILEVLRELQGESILLTISPLSESLRLLENVMNDTSLGPNE